MPEDSAIQAQRRLSLYAYLEPLWTGRRVLEVGRGSGAESAELLKTLGAAQVVTVDADLGGTTGGTTDRFDVVVVPEADAHVRRPGAVASWRRLLNPGGRMVVAAGNADRPGAGGGVGYYDLHGALSPHLPSVQMLGVTPFAGVGIVEFDGKVDALRIESRLVKEPEMPISYVAIAGSDPARGLGYALVQLPASAALGGREAAGRDVEITRVPEVRAEEIEELRARLRRAAEDRTALDAENAKLRKALAEANEAVMTLTRRTTEEMAAVADKLAAGFRAPIDAEARASSAALAEARGEADRLRVKLAESEARAAAAEQRLEEVGGLARARQTEIDDALERRRLAESELGRARREITRLTTESRTAAVDGQALEERSRALAQRDERIVRLEGEKQDLTWRLAEVEDKLRQSIARAVTGGGARAEAAPAAAAPVPATSNEDLLGAREVRERALEEFHRASTAHVEELTELRSSASEQSALVAELEDTLAAAEQRAATAGAEANTLRKTAKDLEEADRSRRARLAELEGKLLRLEHERKSAAARPAPAEPADDVRLRGLESERDRLRARVGELEAAASAGVAARNGHSAGGAALARDLEAVEADLRREEGLLASTGISASGRDAARLENTLDNYRRRAGRLRDDLEGIRRRLESLSPSELSGFLEELGEDLAELG